MNLMEYLEKWARADRLETEPSCGSSSSPIAKLIRAASDKNLEAATLAYTQLTISCVNCHKLVRAAKK